MPASKRPPAVAHGSRRGFMLPARAAWRRAVQQGLALAVAVLAVFAGPLVQAQEWPGRGPIKLVVPFPPGGSNDQIARLLAPVLQQQLGQSVVVENRAGASGVIGTGAVAQSAPDGYTWVIVFDTHGVNPALMPGLNFDTQKDLAPVLIIGTSAMLLATSVNSEYKTMADVVAAVRARKPVSFGTIGSGSLGHLAMTLVGRSANLEWTHVPYKGGGPLLTDAVAGHVPLSIATVFVTKPQVDNKRLRPLAVTSARRTSLMPDVPTFAESGFAGFEAPAWWAILGPARTPPEIVRRMNDEINKAMRQPDMRSKLEAQGIEILGGSPEAARDFIARQIDLWGKVVRENNIKPD